MNPFEKKLGKFEKVKPTFDLEAYKEKIMKEDNIPYLDVEEENETPGTTRPALDN